MRLFSSSLWECIHSLLKLYRTARKSSIFSSYFWNFPRPHQNPSNPIKIHQHPSTPIETHQTPLKSIKTHQRTHQNPSKPIKTHQNPSKPVRRVLQSTRRIQFFMLCSAMFIVDLSTSGSLSPGGQNSLKYIRHSMRLLFSLDLMPEFPGLVEADRYFSFFFLFLKNKLIIMFCCCVFFIVVLDKILIVLGWIKWSQNSTNRRASVNLYSDWEKLVN